MWPSACVSTYIAISIYFGINDGQIAIAFVLCFMMLILLAIDLNDKFKAYTSLLISVETHGLGHPNA